MGMRLDPLTRHVPKALIEVGGKTLLERSLDALEAHGIKETIIVIGHLGDLIEKAVGERHKGMRIRYVHSPDFSDTGSMQSLFEARHLIDGDILLLESDLLYESGAIGIAINAEFRNAFLAAGLLNSGDDVYICVNGSGEITGLGKNIPESERKKACGALLGISKISHEFLQALFEKAGKDDTGNRRSQHYEEYIFELSRSDGKIGGINDGALHAVVCEDLDWIEIDNAADLRRAREEIYPLMPEDG
jgi:choline kinase